MKPRGNQALEQILLQHFGTLISEGALRRVIPVGDAPLLVRDDDRMECRLGDAPESLLGSTDLVSDPGLTMQLPPEQQDAQQTERHDADRQPLFAGDPVQTSKGVDLDAHHDRRFPRAPDRGVSDIRGASAMPRSRTSNLAGVHLEERQQFLPALPSNLLILTGTRIVVFRAHEARRPGRLGAPGCRSGSGHRKST